MLNGSKVGSPQVEYLGETVFGSKEVDGRRVQLPVSVDCSSVVTEPPVVDCLLVPEVISHGVGRRTYGLPILDSFEVVLGEGSVEHELVGYSLRGRMFTAWPVPTNAW